MKQILTTLSVLVAVLVASGMAIADDDDKRDNRGLRFEATLDGAQENPAVDTDTTGRIKVQFNKALSAVKVKLKIRNGVNITRAHFHCNRPGENGPIVLGLFVPGPLDFNNKGARGTLTNADINDDVDDQDTCKDNIGRTVKNIAALAFAMRDGLIYINVHSSDFPGGVIRGQMLEVPRD